MTKLFILLVLYQIKHFLCDFPLQTPYMLGKFKKYPDFIMPLLAHAAVHGLATLLIALVFKPEMALFLAGFDMCWHFGIDRVKASPDLLGRFKALSGTEYVQLLQNKAAAEIVLENPTSQAKTQYEALIAGYNKQFKNNVYFWWALGADQFCHHITHYIIIWNLL